MLRVTAVPLPRCRYSEPVEDCRDVVRPDREHLGELPWLLRVRGDAGQKVEGVVLHERQSGAAGDPLEELRQIASDDHELLAQGSDRYRARAGLVGTGSAPIGQLLTHHVGSVRSPKSLIGE